MSSEEEFNQIGKQGGEKTHTLTINEIPSHVHYVGRSVTRSIVSPSIDGGGGNTAEVHFQNDGGPSSSVGNNYPHNNLQPYIVVKFWRRIS